MITLRSYLIMLLKVDIREKSLIPLLQDEIHSIEKAALEVSSMSVGDAGIYSEEGDELVLFERKTLSDLAASIKDGRYSEQSYRLSGIDVPNHNVVYIIEGTFDKYKGKAHNINSSILLSAIVSLNYFKGFSVMRTCNVNETCELIMKFLDKMLKSNGKKPFYTNEIHRVTDSGAIVSTGSYNYTSVIKRVKKDNVTVDNIVSIMLCQIPNVSTASADAIATQFRTLEQLILACKKGRHMFDEVRIGKTRRRLSSQCINNIMRYVLGQEEERLVVETK